jgi:hypothetical protein
MNPATRAKARATQQANAARFAAQKFVIDPDWTIHRADRPYTLWKRAM